MSEQKKDNAKLKEEFKKTLGNDKLKVENYRQMVDYIKNNKNIDIECFVINTGEDIAKQKHDKRDVVISCDEEKLWEDNITMFAIADKNGDNNRIEQSKNLEKIIFKKSDKPYGVMVLMVNKKGHLQHALSFIVISPTEKDNPKDNSKTKIIPIEAKKWDNPFSTGWEDQLKELFAAFLYNKSFDMTKIKLDNSPLRDLGILHELFEHNLGNRIDFLHPEQYPVMKDASCFFSELMMLTKLLKNEGAEINKIIQDNKERKKIKFPLSIMKYTQIDSFIEYLEKNYKDTDDKDKTQKQLNKVKEGEFTFNDDKCEKKTHNTLIYKKALKLKQQQQAQHINKFVRDNREIREGDITADNLISYFKQEKDRSRSFFWVFGQRNKRFNALCEELEGLEIKHPEQLFRRNADAEDENLIRNLFPDEQQQGNNVNQAVIHNGNNLLLNTQTIKQRITDRLNQVGCFSCG